MGVGDAGGSRKKIEDVGVGAARRVLRRLLQLEARFEGAPSVTGLVASSSSDEHSIKAWSFCGLGAGVSSALPVEVVFSRETIMDIFELDEWYEKER